MSVGSLMDFKDSIYLTSEEKSYRLKELSKSVTNGETDEEMIPFLDQLNMNPHICTAQCCSGHGSGKAHVSIRTDYKFEDLWKRIAPIMHNYNNTPISVQLMQDFGMPRYTFWFVDKWKHSIKILIDALKDDK